MSESTVLEQTTLLHTDGLSVRYGGVSANSDVDITVGSGEIVGLIGPNGAGKTTFVDAVTGFTKATGTVSLAGERLEKASPHRRRRAGMARTWQAGELFTDLTVSQNLAVAVQPVGLRAKVDPDAVAERDATESSVESPDLAIGTGPTTPEENR
ncbi:Lipopolysaccharide export system ATP-binding protein LptB [Gordonia rubripertincta]|nr:ATP-binding cassette domain-containing protein [Gordonia rubripertincta]ASR05128.1 Lipopolysaccharide export system ATP-binding protein LptB [Gordonia rubripertincta]